MNLLFTYWTNKGKNISCGFSHPEYFFDVADMCLFYAKQHNFENIVIYTDIYGKEILTKNLLQISGVNIEVVFYDEYDFDERYWNFPKLITYNLQNEPFLHIDFDVFLKSAGIMDFDTTTDIYTEMLREYKLKKEFIKYLFIKKVFPYQLICSGLIGGSNMQVFKDNFKLAEKKCVKSIWNVNFFDLIAIEEFSFTQLCAERKLRIHELDKSKYDHFQGVLKGLRYEKQINEHKNIIYGNK